MLDHAVTTAPAAVVITNQRADPAPPAQVHVLHLVNGEHFAGAERVQSHLGRCLPEFGVTSDFAFVKPGKFAEMLFDQEGDWGRGFETPMKQRLDLRPAWQVRDLVAQYEYDLLHAHTPRTALIASLASSLCGVPWIYHVHSPAARDSANRWSNRINAWIEKQSLRGCAHLITVSESLRLGCVADGWDEDRISVVHNGVPAIRPQRQATPKVDGPWTLGMVALMRPRKGLEIALEALKKLDAEGHDVTLKCIGPFESDEYRAEVDRQIDELKIGHRVRQVGFVEDVPLALAKLDALVLPSLFGEGLPMVVLEAMAAGLPVVATRVEGTPEAITNGVEGLLAEPRDADSLADAIRELLTGRRDWSLLSDNAHRRHSRSFSDRAMAKGTAEVYRQVLSVHADRSCGKGNE